MDDINMNVFLLGKRIKRSLNEEVFKLMSKSRE